MVPSSRALTKLEQTLLNLDKIACVNFLVVARVIGPLAQEVLENALRQVQQVHVNLQVRVRLAESPASHELVFDPSLVIPLRVVEGGRDDLWRDEAETELSKRFDFERGPLARATLIRGAGFSDVIVCFDHLYADAVSGAHFVKDVLAACGGALPDPGMVYEREALLDMGNFPSGAYGARALVTRIRFIAKMLSELYLTPKRRLPPPSYLEIPDRGSIIVHRCLTQEETASLVRRCAEEGTTVQGALCAALATAFSEHLAAEEHVRRPLLNCISVINLRKYLRTRPEDAELGIYVGQLSYRVTADDPARLWSIARMLVSRLRTDLARSLPFIVYRLLLGREYETPESLMALFEAKQPYVEVSNIGVLSFPDRFGELSLEKMHFASSQHFFQATTWGVNLFVATFGGRLVMNGQFAAIDWSRPDADRILDRAVVLMTG